MDRLTGERKRTDDQNMLDAYRAAQRDREQRDQLISQQQDQQSRLVCYESTKFHSTAPHCTLSGKIKTDWITYRNREAHPRRDMNGPER